MAFFKKRFSLFDYSILWKNPEELHSIFLKILTLLTQAKVRRVEDPMKLVIWRTLKKDIKFSREKIFVMEIIFLD